MAAGLSGRGLFSTRRVAFIDSSASAGKPNMVVSDHGTEFTSNAILAWSKDHRIESHYIAPGKPMQARQ